MHFSGTFLAGGLVGAGIMLVVARNRGEPGGKDVKESQSWLTRWRYSASSMGSSLSLLDLARVEKIERPGSDGASVLGEDDRFCDQRVEEMEAILKASFEEGHSIEENICVLLRRTCQRNASVFSIEDRAILQMTLHNLTGGGSRDEGVPYGLAMAIGSSKDIKNIVVQEWVRPN